MRVLKLPETGAKRILLDAAERLVTERGFDAVSVRDVTGAVKANVAAVNYHFGSRESLMDLVMRRVLEPLCEERIKALDAARQRSAKMLPVEEAVAAYCRSLLGTATIMEMEPPYFLRLAGRILVLDMGMLAPSLAEKLGAVSGRYRDAVSKSLPEVKAHELSARWGFFDAGISQSLLSLAHEDDIGQLMNEWIGIGARGLGAGSGNPAAPRDDAAQGLLFDF